MEIMLIIANLGFGIACLSISYLFKRNYPKEINSFMGYRTKRSMMSSEAWIAANQYSSNLLFRYSKITVLLQFLFIISLGRKVAILSAASLWILFLLITIVQTEVMLKRKQRAAITS